MSQQTNVKTDPNKEVSIYCIILNYDYEDGRNEQSEPKFCGNSKESCFEAISKLVSPCRAVLPESVVKVSFDITAFSRDSYLNHRGADLVSFDVVTLQLRNDYKGIGSE